MLAKQVQKPAIDDAERPIRRCRKAVRALSGSASSAVRPAYRSNAAKRFAPRAEQAFLLALCVTGPSTFALAAYRGSYEATSTKRLAARARRQHFSSTSLHVASAAHVSRLQSSLSVAPERDFDHVFSTAVTMPNSMLGGRFDHGLAVRNTILECPERR